MEKQDMRQRTDDIIRAALRDSGLTRGSQAVYPAADAAASVVVDRAQLAARITAVLEEKTSNPVNALLGLMGLRLVNRKNAALRAEAADSDTLSTLLAVDEARFAAAAEAMCRALAREEQQHLQQEQAQREREALLFRRTEEQEQTVARLTADLEGSRLTVLQHCQYMLSLLGRNAMDAPMARELEELLADLGARAYWDAQDAPFTDRAMFTELKITGAEKRRCKPCIAGEDAVLLKGVRFLPAPAET